VLMQAHEKDESMPILPFRFAGKRRGATVNLVEGMWTELERIADRERYSRSEAQEFLLTWAIQAYRAEKGELPLEQDPSVTGEGEKPARKAPKK
jgi:hypothetical protein